MKALNVALALIRVPRLFISLMFWPLVVAIGLTAVQGVITQVYIRIQHERSGEYRERFARSREAEFVYQYVYGTEVLPPKPALCVWDAGKQPGPECELNSLDVVVRHAKLDDAARERYQKLFAGAVKRIHFCDSCPSEIQMDRVVGPEGRSRNITNVSSVRGLGVMYLLDARRFQDVAEYLVQAFAERDAIEDLRGGVNFYAPGLKIPISVSDATSVMVLILNLAFIVLIALWLALRSHRRVLDYFVKNDALLPLVAACGKGTMYRALWLVTLARVSLFFLISLIPVYFVFQAARQFTERSMLGQDPLASFVWLIAIISGLSSITVTVSVADLRQRQSWSSALYRIVPAVLWLTGTVIWLGTIFSDYRGAVEIQHLIAFLPIFGTTPILLAPLIELPLKTLIMHGVVSLLLLVLMMKFNTTWFAAHLEEL